MGGGQALDEVGAQRLVLAVRDAAGGGEERRLDRVLPAAPAGHRVSWYWCGWLKTTAQTLSCCSTQGGCADRQAIPLPVKLLLDRRWAADADHSTPGRGHLAQYDLRSGGPAYSDITPGFAHPAGMTINPANTTPTLPMPISAEQPLFENPR